MHVYLFHPHTVLFRRTLVSLAAFIGLILGLLAVSPQVVHAASITVNSLADTAIYGDGNCTLLEAINNANGDSSPPGGDCLPGSGADTITFSVSGTITLGFTLPDITSIVTIDGTGQTVAISGNNTWRVFNVQSTGNLTLNAITVQNGYTDPDEGDDGGGIFNWLGTVTVTNSTFSGNSSNGQGGGIENYGTLTVTDSTFSGNSATNGGGIENDGTLTVTNSTFSGNSAINGGGIYSVGTLTVTDSTFSGNSAADFGGGIYNWGPLTVTDSTFSGNSTTGGFGGGFGGGIFIQGGTVMVTSSTLSSNLAGSGGGIYSQGTLTVTSSTLSGNSAGDIGGGIYSQDPLTVTSSTLSGNSATNGGGIYNDHSTVYLSGTLLDTGANGANCYNTGTGYDNGYNLSDDASCGFSGTGSQNNATLGLGVLAYNDGGSTQTHHPGTGSTAIGRIPYGTTVDNHEVTLACNTTTSDQNGITRPRLAGTSCTSGSVEVAAVPEIAVEGPGPTPITDGGTYDMGTTTVGTPITKTITVRNTGTTALTLATNPPTVTGRFAATTFGSTSVAAGGSTTFNLTCNATAAGVSVSGSVSFNNNDSTENPFNFTVTCTVNSPPPEIVVEGPGSTNITDGDTYNLGATTIGTPITRTITVRNTAIAALNLLTNPPTVTGDFAATTFGSTSVAGGGGSTTFNLTCNATAAGVSVSGSVSFDNNDSDENPFNFIVTCTVNIPAPSNLTATAMLYTQIDLAWTDNSSDETAFHIERSADGSSGWAEISTVSADETSYSDTNVSCGTKYYYRVRAFRSGDSLFSNYSNVVNTTPPCSSSSAAPQRNYYTTSTPTLTWNRVSGAMQYEVQVDNAATFTSPLSFTITVPWNTLGVTTTPLPDSTYYWRARAKNGSTTGAWTAVDSFIVDVP